MIKIVKEKKLLILLKELNQFTAEYLEIKTKRGTNSVHPITIEMTPFGKRSNMSFMTYMTYNNNVKRATDKALEVEHNRFLIEYSNMSEPFSNTVKAYLIEEEFLKLNQELGNKAQPVKKLKI